MEHRLPDIDAFKPSSIDAVFAVDKNGQEYTYAPESELASASVPRLARLTKQALFTIRLSWNVFFLFVCVGIFFGQRDYKAWEALANRGRVATAYLTSELPTDTISFHDTDLSYQSVADGNKYTFDKYVSREYARHAPSPLTITYLPGSSGKVYIEGIVTDRRRSAAFWQWADPCLMGGSFLVLLAMSCTGYAGGQLRLLQTGIVVPGLVRAGRVVRKGKSISYLLEYTYGIGEQKQKATTSVTEAQYRAYTQGNPFFTVLYDAASPVSHRPYFKMGSAELVAATL